MGENEYKISLGVELKTSDIKSQIKEAELKLDPITIKVDAETKELTKSINDALKNLSNGTKSALTINTTQLENSINEIRDAVLDVKRVFGTIDDKSSMKSLLSSVNQIADALGKVTDESQALVSSLSALSKKDFSLNFNLKAGNANPVKAMTDYGRAVRDEVIPQLEQQVAYLQKIIGGSTAAENALGNLMTFKYKASGADKKRALLDSLIDDSSLSKQMNAYKKYIGYLKEIASMKGKSLVGFNSEFSKSADELIADAVKIQSGAKDVEDSFDKLKQVFGGGAGINADGLSEQLNPIIEKLEEVRLAVNSLSSGTSISELTQSFNRLSQTLEGLSKHFVLVRNELNTGLSGAASNVGANVVQAFREVDIKAEATEDQIRNVKAALNKVGFDGSSIQAITQEFDNLGIKVQHITSRLGDDNSVTLTVRGLDQFERAVTMMASVDESGFTNLGTTISQSFDETERSFERLKTLAEKIGSLDVKIAGLDTSKNQNEINELTAQVGRLREEYSDLYSITGRNLSGNQIDALNQRFAETIDRVSLINAKMSDVSSANSIKELHRDMANFVKLHEKISSMKTKIGELKEVGGKSNQVAELNRQLEELEATYESLMSKFMKKLSINADIVSFDDVVKFDDEIAAATQKAENDLREFEAKLADTRAELAKKIEFKLVRGDFTTQVQKVNSDVKKLSNASDELQIKLDRLNAAEKSMNDAFTSGGVEERIAAYNKYKAVLDDINNSIKQSRMAEKDAATAQKLNDDIILFQNKIDAYLTKNSASAKQFGARLKELQVQAQNCDRQTLNHLEAEFRQIDAAVEAAGLKTKTFGESLKTQFAKYSSYFSVASLFMYAERALRSMFEQVKLIDSAMTELKKVTNETDAAYEKFLTNAASRAKEIGTTVDGLVASTADFARLGYGFEDAQGLAEVANIYAVVGDEIDGVEQATESLISTMAAFKDEMNGMSNSDFAMSIVDKFNEIGNNFAISSGGIGEALERSASAMAAANNTLDETIALITAANTVVQDPDAVGRLLPTLKVAISVKLLRRTRPSKDLIYNY